MMNFNELTTQQLLQTRYEIREQIIAQFVSNKYMYWEDTIDNNNLLELTARIVIIEMILDSRVCCRTCGGKDIKCRMILDESNSPEFWECQKCKTKYEIEDFPYNEH
jgi:hypothetical protein